jgi:hypothetical protein
MSKLSLSGTTWVLADESSSSSLPVIIGDLTPFTFSDPAGVMTSYAFASDTHEFNMTTQLANANFALNSGTDFTGPRWSKPLVDSAGVAVLAGDRFTMIINISDLDVGASRVWCAAWGVAKIPAVTPTITIAPGFIWAGSIAAGTPNGGIGFNNLATTSTLASATKVAGQILFGGSPGRDIVGGEFVIQSGASTSKNQRFGITNWAGTDADPLQLFIAVSSLGAAATTAGILKMKCSYTIVRI